MNDILDVIRAGMVDTLVGSTIKTSINIITQSLLNIFPEDLVKQFVGTTFFILFPMDTLENKTTKDDAKLMIRVLENFFNAVGNEILEEE